MRRSIFAFVLALGLLATSMGAATAAEPGQRGSERALLAELDARGAEVMRHAETGAVRFIGSSQRSPAASSAELGGPSSARGAAHRFVARYGALFGVDARNLRTTRVDADTVGGSVVRYQQLHDGVPVIAGEIVVQVDRDLDVLSANGEASVDVDVNTSPAVNAGRAAVTARQSVAKQLGIGVAGLVATAPVLSVYDPALLGAPGLGGARLVWRTEVHDVARAINWFVLIDAKRGAVSLQFDQLNEVKNRVTCDAGNAHAKVPCTAGNYARTESSGATGIADVDNAHVLTGQTYDFFFNRFGRDSLNGAGMTLISTVRYCETTCPYANAYWSGSQMVYGLGLTVDDVVGHELSHGFTQFTSRLFYYYQSGAINESLSDVFGELIDITNGSPDDNATTRWQIGEGSSLGAIRDMENPPLFGQPDRMQSAWYAADTEFADRGGVHTNSGVGNKAAYLMVDGGAFNGQTITAIGADKAAAIWYRVATAHLSSGSDYADLGAALSQACTALVGTSVKNSAGTITGTIGSADCTQVGKAVTATEMALQPTDPDAQAPDAPICDSGSPSNVLYDQIASDGAGWVTSGGDSNAGTGWYLDTAYATSNPYHLYGFMDNSNPAPALTRAAGTTLPANAFLRFSHAWEFEYIGPSNYDGGVLEYSTNNGTTWTGATALFTHGGYNGTIEAGTANPLNGQNGFVRVSNGYRSSRLNLASLAGQAVKFRFRISSDDSIGWLGWIIDDFRIYTCTTTGDTTAPTVTAPNADFRLAAITTTSPPIPIQVSFTASDTSGIADTTLQQKVNAGSFTDVALTGTQTSKSLKVTASNTTTRQYRASAKDTPGNTSAFVPGPVFKVKAIQNGSAAVVQAGTWSTQSSASFYGGSVRYASAAGRSESLTATGTDFAIVSTRGPNRGIAAVYVDGVFQTNVDLYSSTTKFRQIVFAKSFAAAAAHTIELRVLGTRNASSTGARVDFDAFLTMTP